MCLYPRLIDNPKYKATKKNGGVIPPIFDERIKSVPIGCGKCIECRKQRAREWQIRLGEDLKENKNAYFITLSFDNESLQELAEEYPNKKGYDLDNAMATLGVKRFLQRWKKHNNNKSVRHWFITELGQESTERVHIHGIIWTDKIGQLQERWLYGNIYVGDYVTERTCNYITKYMTKADEKHPNYKPIILCSHGIGKRYTKTPQFKLHKYNEELTRDYYKTSTGHKIGNPIYYRNKLYSEEEREKLWIDRLNKNTRFILGVEVDISNGLEEYYKGLTEAQKLNEKLGYSKPLTWEQEQYEREQRILKQREIIAKRNNKKKGK